MRSCGSAARYIFSSLSYSEAAALPTGKALTQSPPSDLCPNILLRCLTISLFHEVDKEIFNSPFSPAGAAFFTFRSGKG